MFDGLNQEPLGVFCVTAVAIGCDGFPTDATADTKTLVY